ncbi:TetR/AcrR family tetracycline transcriptional repressor [Actinocrispum wychmicini]|uniref:TetR/AcrR family tetracycline transcriptional repressor n=1 Tax=Actinocrispum wychmicini TaxID=1213861 RepID=A0A4R2K6T5_9PSEU|nr:TetR/AcrR family tetracycline transcriptional repressor [Actinocrispum wychmicini]
MSIARTTLKDSTKGGRGSLQKGRKRVSRDDVVAESLALLDESGIAAVTLRGVAKRMQVHLNSVSFQVNTKARLFELLADAILGELSLNDLPEDPRDRIAEMSRRLRLALLAHRDGARVVAGTKVLESNTLHVAEVIVAAFLELGTSEAVAARTAWALHCLLIGLVQEEQFERSDPASRYEASAEKYPTLARVERLFMDDTFDERSEFGIAALISHALSTIEALPRRRLRR